jgi:hypothetical protein
LPDCVGGRSSDADEQEAFEAMRHFLTEFWKRGGSEPGTELADLLSWIGQDVWADGATNDPAQWHDWLAAVRAVRPGPAAAGG